MKPNIAILVALSIPVLSSCSDTSTAPENPLGDSVAISQVSKSDTPFDLVDPSVPVDLPAPVDDEVVEAPVAVVEPIEAELMAQAINEDNYLALLVQAFEVYFGTAYDQRMPTDHMKRLETGDVMSTKETVDGIKTTYYSTYACPNGGTTEKYYVGGLSPSIYYGYTVDNCQYNNELVEGKFTLSGYRDTTNNLIDLENFTVKFGSNDSITVDGAYRRHSFFTTYGKNPSDYTEHWKTVDLNYEIHYLGSTLSVENATTKSFYGFDRSVQDIDSPRYYHYKAYLEGSFQMNTPISKGNSIDVSTPTVFTQSFVTSVIVPDASLRPYDNPPKPRFANGQMLLTADDGSSLMINATDEATGLPTVVLTTSEGSQNVPFSWESLDDAMTLRDIEIEYPATF